MDYKAPVVEKGWDTGFTPPRHHRPSRPGVLTPNKSFEDHFLVTANDGTQCSDFVVTEGAKYHCSDSKMKAAFISTQKSLKEPVYLAGTQDISTPKRGAAGYGLGTSPIDFFTKADLQPISLFLEKDPHCSWNFKKCIECSGKLELDKCMFCGTCYCCDCKERRLHRISKCRFVCQVCKISQKIEIPCSRCGSRLEKEHSRSCIKCMQHFCKKCKHALCSKVAKKTWICEICEKKCASRVTKSAAPVDAACIQCGQFQSSDRHARDCIFCMRTFCGSCKKAKMTKVGNKRWYCNFCGGA